MRALALIALAAALSACGKQATTTTTSNSTITTTVAVAGNVATTNDSSTTTSSTTTGSTALPTAASLGIQPGKWEMTVAIVDLKMSGLPAGVSMPKRAPTTVTTCVTPEQAAKGPGDFLKDAGGRCTATTSTYSGGKIDVAMTCKMPGGTMTTRSTGTYSPTAMTADAEATMTGRVSMTEKVHTEAHRIGDCG